MRKRRRSRDFEINLDSLTDIMANTVGIMIFVMIFAVMSARGTYLKKHLPILQGTVKQRVLVICADGEVRPFNVDKLVGRILDPFYADLKRSGYYGASAVADRLNNAKSQDAYFECTAQFQYSDDGVTWRSVLGYLVIKPRPGSTGISLKDLKSPDSGFHKFLSGLNKEKQYVLFLVSKDDLELFREARRIAKEQGFKTNWDPEKLKWPYRERFFPPGPPGDDGTQDSNPNLKVMQ